MLLLIEIIRALTIVAFIVYGASILMTDNMTEEFKRYGLSHLRTLTGWLQIFGALGLLAGYRYPALGAAAAIGLALLMAVGVLTRIRVGDPIITMIPAFAFCVLNVILFAYAE